MTIAQIIKLLKVYYNTIHYIDFDGLTKMVKKMATKIAALNNDKSKIINIFGCSLFFKYIKMFQYFQLSTKHG